MGSIKNMKGCKILNQDESNNNIMKIGKNMGEKSMNWLSRNSFFY